MPNRLNFLLVSTRNMETKLFYGLTPQQVLTQLIQLKCRLEYNITKDTEDKDPVDDQSILSLNTPVEQLQEWIQVIDEINRVQ